MLSLYVEATTVDNRYVAMRLPPCTFNKSMLLDSKSKRNDPSVRSPSLPSQATEPFLYGGQDANHGRGLPNRIAIGENLE